MDDETRTRRKLTSEFRRMDDELAASVALPAVDSVIRRAGTANRATTAAAAAVFTVGSLGGITAVAQASTPQVDQAATELVAEPAPAPAALVPGPSLGEQQRAAQAPPTTTVAPARPTVVVKPKAPVKPKPVVKPKVTVKPKPVVKPKPTVVPDEDDAEGKPDPTKAPAKPSVPAAKPAG